MLYIKSALEPLIYIFLMGMLALLSILFSVFTFQRYFYFFGVCNKERPENTRVRLVVSKDQNEVEVYLFDRGSKKDLIYMPGNMIIMEEYLDFCKFLSDVFGCNVISMAYRGINGNPKTPSERGIVEDIKALARYLDDRTVACQYTKPKKTRKVVLGFSMGSAAGIHLANLCSVDSLVLINPFMSLLSAAETSKLGSLARFLLVDKWDNVRNIRNVAVPIYFIVSERDEMIPPYHSDKLIKNTRHYEKYLVYGASHNEPVSYPERFMSCVYPVVLKALKKG